MPGNDNDEEEHEILEPGLTVPGDNDEEHEILEPGLIVPWDDND